MRRIDWTPQSWVLCKAEEPSWVVGGPQGLIGGMWGAWRLLARSTGVLACLQAGWREVCSRGAVSPVTTGEYPQPKPSKCSSPAHPMAQCCPHAGMAMTRRKLKLRCRSNLVPGQSWVGRWWPLLTLSQAAPQEPRSLTVAALPQLISSNRPEVSAGPTCHSLRLPNRAGEAGDRGCCEG